MVCTVRHTPETAIDSPSSRGPISVPMTNRAPGPRETRDFMIPVVWTMPVNTTCVYCAEGHFATSDMSDPPCRSRFFSGQRGGERRKDDSAPKVHVTRTRGALPRPRRGCTLTPRDFRSCRDSPTRGHRHRAAFVVGELRHHHAI